MYYWNKEAFEHLTHLADVLEEDPCLALLPAYCRWRKRGLRREAFKSLDQRMDASLFEKALAVNPDDVPVRRQLATTFLASVEYATHHLVESRLLDDIAVVKRALNDACAVAGFRVPGLPLSKVSCSCDTP